MTIVVVGGVEPGGGAGVLRDLTTAVALGARAHVVGTAWTEQAAGIHRVEPRAPEGVRAALAEAVAALRPAAVKVGMGVGAATAEAILAGLGGFAGPVVVDPVLATSRGGRLWDGPLSMLMPLLRRATLVTPNGPEAAALAGRPVEDVADAESAGQALVAGERLAAVLVKGGHLGSGGRVTDVLVTPAGAIQYDRARLPGPSPRGTGCALATAVAVCLGRGLPLEAAIQAATAWLAGAIAAAREVGGERHLGP